MFVFAPSDLIKSEGVARPLLPVPATSLEAGAAGLRSRNDVSVNCDRRTEMVCICAVDEGAMSARSALADRLTALLEAAPTRLHVRSCPEATCTAPIVRVAATAPRITN